MPSPKPQEFKRVLVANRGEIAVRIIRTLREMNIESVAVFAADDHQSLHVRLADYAVELPGHSLRETYLNIAKICQATTLSGCDGVHPGYGFLAENPDFVRSLEKLADIRFIGPSAQAMSALGDKIKARSLAAQLQIPILPGCSTPLSSLKELLEVSQTIGFPLVIKAAAGGGGKGMRIVRTSEELEDAYKASQREALAFFGCDEVYCERYLEKPRHIEFQTLFDHHGQGVHVFERDCSIQRRYQKLFEEAPSEYLSPQSREKMGAVAVKLGQSAHYTGAATVEFICESPETFYFMEMNTRIQVEHPVTEMITGVDLIKETIRIAAFHPLSFKQEELSIQGHAIEVRINAEDPTQDFIPLGGRCEDLHWPGGAFVRVDSHITSGYVIPDLYDSMIAKIIVWAKDRPAAIERMKRALAEFRVSGITTTALFHEALLHHPLLIQGDFATTFLQQQREYFEDYYRGKKGPSKNQAKEEKLQEEEQDLLLALIASQEHLQNKLPMRAPDRKRWMELAKPWSLRSSEEMF